MPAESFDFRPSKIFIIVLFIVHVATGWVILSCHGNAIIKGTVFVLCAISCFWNLNRHCEVKKIFWDEKEGWKIQNKNGEIYSANITRQNICTSWVAGLNFNRKPLIIFFDSMNRETFRRLRVLLKHGRIVYEN